MTLKEKLMNIQAELKAPKNLRNSFGNYNYRNVESILEALKPLLVKYKATVTITDTIEFIADRIYVKAVATIYDVENKDNFVDSITSTAYAREAEVKKGMDEAQITGATSSYARKYALNGLFLLDDTQDVDTEAYQEASQKGADKPAQAPKEKPKAKPAKPTEAKVEPLTEEELLFLSQRYTGANLAAVLDYYHVEDISLIPAAEGRKLIAMIKAKGAKNNAGNN